MCCYVCLLCWTVQSLNALIMSAKPERHNCPWTDHHIGLGHVKPAPCTSNARVVTSGLTGVQISRPEPTHGIRTALATMISVQG